MTPDTRTSDFFDSYAHDFDAIYGNRNSLINRIANRFLRKSMMLRYLRTVEGCDPIEGRSVIDIGCGPGHYGIALAKRGASRVVGLDFAEGMIELARKHAERAGVAGNCEFICADFMDIPLGGEFDYAILMGFMDYAEKPGEVVGKALSVARSAAFFSFPADGGLLSWQRKLRYRRKCDLYMYKEADIIDIFAGFPGVSVKVDRIARDYFVEARVEERKG
jgi:2-polyprenyl-3-methyl-5-hydroxy-6-metoxy-1,4-benzoquinol methylase